MPDKQKTVSGFDSHQLGIVITSIQWLLDHGLEPGGEMHESKQVFNSLTSLNDSLRKIASDDKTYSFSSPLT
ncbi:hypothetical protein DFP72DRAFT_1062738 [Ephemerocybe angulata]|uniref:Uncharacterized protein n=1 Tax=Ephemerocybe angulata TaxID=980116 RepID=A0A8H6I7I9_9AGAR|nr:hypothetical protein DFP72DRAFT_1062738 [Tulosesus angulatus]